MKPNKSENKLCSLIRLTILSPTIDFSFSVGKSTGCGKIL